jgi:hypothetical protein
MPGANKGSLVRYVNWSIDGIGDTQAGEVELILSVKAERSGCARLQVGRLELMVRVAIEYNDSRGDS